MGKAFLCGFQGACSKDFLLSKLQPIHLHTSRREAVAAGVVVGSCSWQPSALTVPRGSSGHKYLNMFGSLPVLPSSRWNETAEKRAAGTHILELDKNIISSEM